MISRDIYSNQLITVDGRLTRLSITAPPALSKSLGHQLSRKRVKLETILEANVTFWS